MEFENKTTGHSHRLFCMEVEYAWTPQRCNHCKVYGHLYSTCPKVKHPKVIQNQNNPNHTESRVDEEGFTKMTKNQNQNTSSQSKRGRSRGPKKKQVYNNATQKKDHPRENSLVRTTTVFQSIERDMQAHHTRASKPSSSRQISPPKTHGQDPVHTSNRFAHLGSDYHEFVDAVDEVCDENEKILNADPISDEITRAMQKEEVQNKGVLGDQLEDMVTSHSISQ